MPRKHKPRPDAPVPADCFAYRAALGAKPACGALKEIYCLFEDKPCSFYATSEDAEASRGRSEQRLRELGALDEYRERYKQ